MKKDAKYKRYVEGLRDKERREYADAAKGCDLLNPDAQNYEATKQVLTETAEQHYLEVQEAELVLQELRARTA